MMDRFLRIGQVMDKVGLSRTTIFRMEKANEFPRGVIVHGRSKRWSENEVDNWIDEMKAERQPALNFLGIQHHIESRDRT